MNNMKAVNEENPFQPLPVGQYKVMIVEVGHKKNQNDDDMFTLKIEIIKGEYKGKWFNETITISDNTESPSFAFRWKTKQFFKAIGEPYSTDNLKWDSDDWIYKECLVDVEHRIAKSGKWKGSVFAGVKKFIPLTEKSVEKKIEQNVEKKDDPDIPF